MSKNFYLISITETKESTFNLLQDRAGPRFKVEYVHIKVDLAG